MIWLRNFREKNEVQAPTRIFVQQALSLQAIGNTTQKVDVCGVAMIILGKRRRTFKIVPFRGASYHGFCNHFVHWSLVTLCAMWFLDYAPIFQTCVTYAFMACHKARGNPKTRRFPPQERPGYPLIGLAPPSREMDLGVKFD